MDVGVQRLSRRSVDDSKRNLKLGVPLADGKVQAADCQGDKPALVERRLEVDDAVRDFPDVSPVRVDVVLDERTAGVLLVEREELGVLQDAFVFVPVLRVLALDLRIAVENHELGEVA